MIGGIAGFRLERARTGKERRCPRSRRMKSGKKRA
jgi:hypothetical protein